MFNAEPTRVPPSVARLATHAPLRDNQQLWFSTEAEAKEILALVLKVVPNAKLRTGQEGSRYEDNLDGMDLIYMGDSDLRVYHISGSVDWVRPADPSKGRYQQDYMVVTVLDAAGLIIDRHRHRAVLETDGQERDGEVLAVRIDSDANDGSGGAELLWRRTASIFHL